MFAGSAASIRSRRLRSPTVDSFTSITTLTQSRVSS